MKEQAPIAAIASSKSTMSITDRIAKHKEMMDNCITKTDKVKTEITSIDQLNKELLETKPKMSKDPEKWINKGGKITIDENGTWTYHDWEGNSVSYPYSTFVLNTSPLKNPSNRIRIPEFR